MDSPRLRGGLTAQNETRAAALEVLDDVVAAVTGEGGHEPTDAGANDVEAFCQWIDDHA